MSQILHISSLLVTARPETVDAVNAYINAMPIAEVAHSDHLGKIIVTLETLDESAIVQALTDIQLVTGVVSAALVYHHAEGINTADLAYQPSVEKGSTHV